MLTDAKEFINNASCWYFEKIIKTPLAQLTKKIKVQEKSNNIRDRKDVMIAVAVKI